MVQHLQRARLALRAQRGDDGIALVAAIGVAIVALMLATTVVAVTVRSATATGEGRDRDQAYTAAEAGLDAATAVLRGASSGWSSVCTSPATALTSRSTYQTVVAFGGGLSGAGTVTGAVACGASTAAYAQIDSTGTAQTGSGRQQVQRLRAVVKLPGAPIAAAVYANTIPYSGYSTVNALGATALYVGEGNYTCGSSAALNGRVVVSSSQLITSTNCGINGPVRAKSLQMNSGSVINGDVVVQQASAIDKAPDATINGSKTSDAPESDWGPTPLPRLRYALSDWTSLGFTTGTWPQSGCTMDGLVTLAGTQPRVIDTRAGCPSGLKNSSDSSSLVINSDVVLVVNKFLTTTHFTIKSATGDHTLWLLNPAPSAADCSNDEAVSLGDGFKLSASVTGFLYSDCYASLHGTGPDPSTWQGQIWAARFAWYEAITITYEAVAGPVTSGTTSVVSKVSVSGP